MIEFFLLFCLACLIVAVGVWALRETFSELKTLRERVLIQDLQHEALKDIERYLLDVRDAFNRMSDANRALEQHEKQMRNGHDTT